MLSLTLCFLWYIVRTKDVGGTDYTFYHLFNTICTSLIETKLNKIIHFFFIPYYLNDCWSEKVHFTTLGNRHSRQADNEVDGVDLDFLMTYFLTVLNLLKSNFKTIHPKVIHSMVQKPWHPPETMIFIRIWMLNKLNIMLLQLLKETIKELSIMDLTIKKPLLAALSVGSGHCHLLHRGSTSIA